MQTTIWHNPRCTKSRETLALLEEHGIEPAIRRYLDDPPTADEIREALETLGLEPRSLMRTKEAVYKELGLKMVDDDDQLIAAMADNPKLIERPVVFHDGRAAIGRPPESVLEILGFPAAG